MNQQRKYPKGALTSKPDKRPEDLWFAYGPNSGGNVWWGIPPVDWIGSIDFYNGSGWGFVFTNYWDAYAYAITQGLEYGDWGDKNGSRKG